MHWGRRAAAKLHPAFEPRDLVAGADAGRCIVVVDGVEGPHNLGAILGRSTPRVWPAWSGNRAGRRRSAARRPRRRRARSRTSRIAEVVNIARAVEELKEPGVWTVGLAGDAPNDPTIDLTLPTALVLGGEGSGLRRLVRERCDWLVSIPLHGHVGSLNVSVAPGFALFEAVRQRSSKARPAPVYKRFILESARLDASLARSRGWRTGIICVLWHTTC